MNRYEAVVLDKMVELNNDNEDGRKDELIINLLDCICEWRKPPAALAVEKGYGALVGGTE